MTKRPRRARGPGRRDVPPPPTGAAGRPGLAPVLLAYAFVFACACAVFWPTVAHSFLNWDDNVYVLKNPWIRQLTWDNIRAIFTRPYFQNYLPLHIFSYMLDHAVWGLKPAGFHMSSVLLHGVNSALCLAVVRRLTGSMAAALVAALLFAVHPAHVEAVAWVSSRKEILSTTFMLLSLLSYLGARKGNALRPVPYAASVLWFLLAMLSKVSVVVLPAFLLLLDAMPDPANPRARRRSLLIALASKIPYGIAGAVLVLVNSHAQVTAKAAYAHEPLLYLTVKGHAVWNYLGLLIGLGGNPDYDLPRIGGGLDALLQLGGLAVLPAAAFVLYRFGRRIEFLGVSWVFLTLLPAILFPLVTYMADRYLYAPSIGFCWALAAVIVGAGNRARAPARASRYAAAAVTAAIAIGFSIRTLQYSRVWKDSESLWTYALTKSHDYRVYNNLADVRVTQKRFDEAERLLKQGAAVENVTSHQGLGVLYYSLGRHDEALVATDRAIAILAGKGRDPALMAELRFNRGAIFWAQGKSALATEEWRAALREDPGHAQAREWLGTAEGRQDSTPSR